MSDASGIIEDDITVDENTGEVTQPTQATTAGALVVRDAIARLSSGDVGVYSTVIGDDFEAKRNVLAAVTTAEQLSEHFGKHIDLVNIVVQEVEIEDNVTHVKTVQPRVILLDQDGTAYYAISPVVLRAVSTFIGVLGQPHTWPGPVGIKVTRERAKVGFFYNMTLDSSPKKK